MKKIILFSAFILSIAYSCKKDEKKNQGYDFSDLKSQTVINNSNSFGFDLLKQVNSSEAIDNNFMISPTSVALALAMTYNGSSGQTKEAFEQIFHLQGMSTTDINNVFSNLMNHLITNDPGLLLQIANSIWYRNTFYVQQSFLDTNTFYYNSIVSPLDFNNPASKDIINNWVASNTNNKITSIIDEIDPQTVMFLINAIYFNGLWKYSFNPQSTIQNSFTLENGSIIQVPFMVNDNNYNFYSNSLFNAIELPYMNNKMSMIVFLPTDEKTVTDIIDSLSTSYLNNCLQSFTIQNKILQLPKFEFEYKNILNDELVAMGLGVAFDGGSADFSRINTLEQLFISKVVHKTYIKVNEEGTEAAAVTSVEIGVTSFPSNYFTVNKPFLFMIRDIKSGAIVFTGRVSNPS